MITNAAPGSDVPAERSLTTVPLTPPVTPPVSRRTFVKSTAAIAGTVAFAGAVVPEAFARLGVHNRVDRLKVGVIGCGGRGTGAMINSLEGSYDTEIHAIGDVFADRVDNCMAEIQKQPKELMDRCPVSRDRAFVGFDAYKRVLATNVDVVILATNPHFRPMHFEAAIAAGKHVFFEKPVAVDPTGVRRVIAAGEVAKQKGLGVVCGTQRRHENCYLAAMKQIEDGGIGRVVAANCWWNQGSLWHKPRQEGWSDMEWQLHNWLYFTWLSGDHIVEQHVHNLDVCNWAIGSNPLKCTAMGGRQVRTGPEYGHIYDHFAVQYEYKDGVTMNSQCRQIDGCAAKVQEQIIGSEGVLNTNSGSASIKGKTPWKYTGEANNPYVTEHTNLIESIKAGKPLNEARRIAESTLTAIMGRMSAYTGKEVTWEFAMNSKLDLSPPSYEMGPLPVPAVAMPGKTALI